MSKGLNELKKKIGTTKAKQQHAQRRADQKADEKRVMGAAAAEQERIAKGGVNFALCNFILSTTSFKDCAPGTMEPVYLMYTRVMTHMDRVCREAAEMAKELDREFIHPTVHATNMLKEITESARARSKANAYLKKRNEIKTYS